MILSLTALFYTLSASAETCPSIKDIQINCNKQGKMYVCDFSADNKRWYDKEKYEGISTFGKIDTFVGATFKAANANVSPVLGKVDKCIYSTTMGWK